MTPLTDAVLARLREESERRRNIEGGKGKPITTHTPRVVRTPLKCIHLGQPTGSYRSCTTCNKTIPVPVMVCAVHGTCTESVVASGLKCCGAMCQDKETVQPTITTLNPMKTKWSYGITTVPERRADLFPRTLLSLKTAGFDTPHLFVDGDDDGLSWSKEFNLATTARGGKNVRTAGHWVLSAYELYAREPGATHYALFQDDLVTVKNLRAYLSSCAYPAAGYFNLYTFPSNSPLRLRQEGLPAPPDDHRGWYQSNQSGRGAVALVFTKEALTTLFQQKHLVERPQHAARGWKAIDGGIVDSFKKIGWKEYVHAPSLVQHTGKASSMGNREHPSAPSFPGEDFDALTLLPSRESPPAAFSQEETGVQSFPLETQK